VSDDWTSVGYLIRCDEAAFRMAAQLRDWLDETNHVFLGIAHGMPHLWREMDEAHGALKEMHARVSDESAYRGAESPRRQIVRTFQQLIDAHREDQQDLVAFAGLFSVVHEVRTALSSLKDLMDDVECFSVNAIVQAHNAGDRGRGFSQVSREVVSLTKRATTEFDRVRAQAQRIEEHLGGLQEAVTRTHERFEESPIKGRGDVDALFKGLDEARGKVVAQVDTLVDGVAESAGRVSRMLVCLQFDDRATRVSEHLAAALEALHDQIAGLTQADAGLAAGPEPLLDAATCAAEVFGQVGDLVATVEGELTGIRGEMSSFLEGLALDLQHKADGAVDADGLIDVIGRTRAGLEAFVAYMRELVSGKAEIVSRAEDLAGLIFDLRDALEGVRRTAKRFGVMASIIKVELASAGLSEEFGDALSADRVETLYRDMASAVGSVLISLESTVKQVQRRCGAFRQGLVRQEDTLRQAEAYTARLVGELDGTLVHFLTRGGALFKGTLLKLHRESTAMRMEVGNILSLGRQSGRIKGDALDRRQHLMEIRAALLERGGLQDWAIRDPGVRALLAGYAEGMRENAVGTARIVDGDAEGAQAPAAAGSPA
jgi:hypothetical protein